jgi:hypothetical protein
LRANTVETKRTETPFGFGDVPARSANAVTTQMCLDISFSTGTRVVEFSQVPWLGKNAMTVMTAHT